jgi:8-oxo-dGTP pyrophosphatase MutT (NUDIX family)
MVREFSAGGVVLRRGPQGWRIAVIEPQREAWVSSSKQKKLQKLLLALPKGLVDPGETPEQTALREVFEETGLTATPVAKLTDIKYVYVRSWGDGEKVFKIVSFYLLKYKSGKIGNISEEMKIEVKRACWMPLSEAVEQLSYKGEKDVVRRAEQYLKQHPDVQPEHDSSHEQL